MIKDSKIKVEESFLISEQGYTMGKLLDGMECQVLLDTGVSKSFMSKSHYLFCKPLHSLPKFASRIQKIQIGNKQFVSVLFIIPIIIDIHGHRFEYILWYLRSMKTLIWFWESKTSLSWKALLIHETVLSIS